MTVQTKDTQIDCYRLYISTLRHSKIIATPFVYSSFDIAYKALQDLYESYIDSVLTLEIWQNDKILVYSLKNNLKTGE